MLRRILTAALIAGAAASLILSAGTFLKLEPLIRAAEVFEAADHAAAPAHDHEHEHGASAEAQWPQGRSRVALTLLANLVAAVGFALVLTSAIALRGEVDAPRGALWGLAGFTAFALAPALGLPPELPGMAAAALHARQAWWAATAGLTAAALALLVFAEAWWLKAVALALALAPHLYGAPRGDGHGSVPAELAAAFAASSLVVNAVFWVALGAMIGHLMRAPARTVRSIAAS